MSISQLLNEWINFYFMYSPDFQHKGKEYDRKAILERINSGDCGTTALAVGIVWNGHNPDDQCAYVDNYNHAYLQINDHLYDTYVVRGITGHEAMLEGKAPNAKVETVTFDELYHRYVRNDWVGAKLIQVFCLSHKVLVPYKVTDTLGQYVPASLVEWCRYVEHTHLEDTRRSMNGLWAVPVTNVDPAAIAAKFNTLPEYINDWLAFYHQYAPGHERRTAPFNAADTIQAMYADDSATLALSVQLVWNFFNPSKPQWLRDNGEYVFMWDGTAYDAMHPDGASIDAMPFFDPVLGTNTLTTYRQVFDKFCRVDFVACKLIERYCTMHGVPAPHVVAERLAVIPPASHGNKAWAEWIDAAIQDPKKSKLVEVDHQAMHHTLSPLHSPEKSNPNE